MAEEENTKTKNGHEVSIALIQKDIQYMRESMTKIELTMSLIDKNFARKDELVQLEKLVGDMAKNWETSQKELQKSWDEKLKEKVNNSDFEPIKSTLTKINWMVIAAVLVGLLSLVVGVGLKQ